MPIFTWKGMISSSMHLTHFSCCPGRTCYCLSSKNMQSPSFECTALANSGKSIGAPGTVSNPQRLDGPTAAPDGSFLIAWHEEQFPSVKTVVQTVRVGAPVSR